MRRARPAGVAAALALAALAFPATAGAHGIVGRADLPVPAWLFGWAAAVVLVISFVALGALWPKPRLQRVGERSLPRMPVVVDLACGALGVAVFAVVVYAGLAGSQLPSANLAPVAVYVVFWVGFPVASVLLGDVFAAFSPWRAVARAARFAFSRTGGAAPAPLSYPAWLGHWPAAATILGFAWLELAYQNRADPSTLAVLGLLYALVQLCGMTLFGIEAWSERADGFGVLFGLYARLAPLARRGRTPVLRPPLGGAPPLGVLPGTVALLCAAIGSTTFDGLSNGSVWASVGPRLTDAFGHLGSDVPSAGQWAATVGLVVCVGLVAGFYRLATGGMQSVGPGRDPREVAALFAHTLIPIAFAYALAHYFSLLAYQGQSVLALASDPLGRGSDLFGTATSTIDYGVISATGIWYVQVGALVCGHVAGLVLAHDRAVALYPDTGDALRSQAWMLVVMVGFTSVGLWLLSVAA